MIAAHRGRQNYEAGLAAEGSVQRLYEAAGYRVAGRRWRGVAGEIDLIFRKGAEVVFVEVKKSANILRASENLSMSQLARVARAAEEYLATLPTGLDTPARVDVALVDRHGQTSVIENATVARSDT